MGRRSGRVALPLAVLLSACAPAQAWTEREMSVPAAVEGSARLFGTLTLPDGDAKVPALLIIPGSGPTDRDGNTHLGPRTLRNDSLKLLAQGLAERGIASLRIDKRGIAASRAAATSEEELRFEGNVADALLWLDALGRDPRVARTAVLGHSEGATVATLVAGRHRLAGLVLVAGPGETAGQIIRHQLGRKGLPPAALAEIERILASLERGELVPDAPRELWALFRPSVQPYMISWLAIDPERELARVTTPVLIIQGTADLQVGVDDARRLAAALPAVQPMLIEDMNHVLKRVPPGDAAANTAAYSNPDLPLAAGLVDAVAGFVLSAP